MPNTFAYVMLTVWPIVMIILFKKLSLQRALIVSFLGGYAVLPPNTYFDLPMIPTLDKYSVPSVAALVLCLTMVEQKIRLFPKSRLVSILMVGYLVSPFVTMAANTEPVFAGPVILPGISIRDAISEFLKHVIILIPFVLSFNFLSTNSSRREFLTLYMVAGLIYSIPILLEVRLSPQLNNWVYGFYPQLFAQQIRFGGFRATVFLGHGLAVSFFVMMSLIATAALWRSSLSKDRGTKFAVLSYLFVILILCKSVGPALHFIIFAPVIMFAGPRVQRWTMLVCVTFLFTYPVLRATDTLPVDQILDFAGLIQEERAQSLGFRFDNERMLLERAAEKPLTGWGFWNRNRNLDPETGRILTVPDGYWIIVIGVLGWFGYICIFGLLSYPLVRLWVKRKECIGSPDEFVTHGVTIMLGIYLLEAIPNASVTHFTWILAGMLVANPSVLAQEKVEDTVEARLDTSPTQPSHKRAKRGQIQKFDPKQRENHRKKRHPR